MFKQIVLGISKFLQILSLQPRISKFFLTVGRNNFDNKIPNTNSWPSVSKLFLIPRAFFSYKRKLEMLMLHTNICPFRFGFVRYICHFGYVCREFNSSLAYLIRKNNSNILPYSVSFWKCCIHGKCFYDRSIIF